MAAAKLLHDTIPSPFDSGEFAVPQIELRSSDRSLGARCTESLLADLRAAVNGIRCPDHEYAPALTVDFGGEDDPFVLVIPQGCCPKLDRLVASSLASSPVFRVLLPE